MTGHALVTGGAGFIGSHVADVLLSRGYAVTVLDDLSVGTLENLVEAQEIGGLRFVRGSICDEVTVQNIMDGCDTVYHMAVQCVRRSLGNPRESHDVNATGTITVLEAAYRARVKRFVYCSSSEVYGNASTGLLREDVTICKPMTVYGAAKLAGEHYTEAYFRTYGLPACVVRPFNAYGPRAYQRGTRAEVLPRFVGRVLNGLAPVIFGDPSNGRDFTYVTEIAEGIVKAGEASDCVGQSVNLAAGRMITVEEVATTVMNILGRNDLSIEHRDPRPGDVHQLHADTAKAKQLMGYAATIPFDRGVRDYVAWVKRRYPDPKVLLDQEIENWSLCKPNSESPT